MTWEFVRIRNQDEILGIVMAMWFCLLYVEAVVSSRNLVVFIYIYIYVDFYKCVRGYKTEYTIFWLWKFFLVPLILPGTKRLSLTLNWWGKYNIFCFTSLWPENISKVQGQASSILPQKGFTEVAGALNTC